MKGIKAKPLAARSADGFAVLNSARRGCEF